MDGFYSQNLAKMTSSWSLANPLFLNRSNQFQKNIAFTPGTVGRNTVGIEMFWANSTGLF